MDGDWVEDGGQAYTPRSYRKTKRKMKFVGWGSRELIDFLKSIGKDTSKKLSHYDVTNIVNQYVIDCKLIHPEKKKRVVCNERLQILFGGRKQSVFRNKIHDLLEPHLVENHVDSDEDRFSSDENEDDASVSKRQKLSTSTVPRKKTPQVPKSSLAAICLENIKLVYLKRSLVLELLRYPQTFERKIVGSFVKTKSDPYDIFQKNSHQLQLVTGVKEVASSGDNRSAMLQIANMTESISVSALSDDNFSEEECEDLHRRIKDGLLKHPTVGELEQTAIILHEDITKNWIARELVLLKIRTDQANEKGWRHRVMEYTNKRRLLETPEEQSRLLNEIPTVLPVKVEQEIAPDDSPDCVNQNADNSPKADDWDWEPCYESSAKGQGLSTKVSSKHNSQEQRQHISEPLDVSTRTNGHALPSKPHEASPLQTEQIRTETNRHINPMEHNQISFHRTEVPRTENNHHAQSLTPIQKTISDAGVVRAKKGDFVTEDPKSKKVEVITLSDDEEEAEIPSKTKPAQIEIPSRTKPAQIEIPSRTKPAQIEIPSRIKPAQIPLPNLEHLPWHYLDPMGKVQGPFSLVSLKRWSDLGYFQPGFRIWMSGQRPEEAVLLSSVLQHVFPSGL